jgi:hypothetical protein
MDHTDDTSQHPEELLAVYADGTATATERAGVEAHVSACARCRDEVALAMSAYLALRALPEVDPPVIGAVPRPASSTQATEARGPADVVDLRSRRRTWLKAGAGLAAAAAVVIGFVAVMSSGGLGTRTSSAPNGAGATSAGAAAPARSVTTTDLAALANHLAGRTSVGLAPQSGSTGGSAVAASPTVKAGGFRSEFAPGATISCAASAAGLPKGVPQIYAEPIVLDAVSAWVVGYREAAEDGGAAHVVVVAVSRDDCRVLYLARVPAAS